MKLFYFTFLGTILFSQIASAQFFVGPALSGSGGAGRAAIDGSESALVNPATLGYMDRYNMTLPFAEGWHPAMGYAQTYGVVLTDGSDDKIIPGALAYLRQREISGGIETKRQDVQLSLAERATKFFSVGLS